MEIKIIKNRSDIGAGTRGSDMGIDAIEIAAINQNNDFFHRYSFVDVKTHNESIYHKNTNNFAKRIEHVKEQCQRVADAVKETIISGDFPIVLSGDHSSALGTISGIKAANPEKAIGVIWIDAHADLHSPYTSPSGNIHGMPLAAAMNMDNLGAKINEPGENTAKQWNELKNIGIPGSKIIPAHLVYFGLRDFETAEKKIIDQSEILFFEVEETRAKGLEFCIQKAVKQLNSCDQIYISFDVDSLDCDRVSYGTGTPVPIGFSSGEIKELLALFIATKKVCCVEFTEVNPLLDNKGNKMAETAFEILDQLVIDLMRP
jgi:arginase